MKIKQMDLPFEEAAKLPRPAHKKPRRPSLLFRTLVRILAGGDLRASDFSYTLDKRIREERGPFLILMNHSCFLDLEMVSKIFYPKPYCIVCTSDGFIGKEWLMRHLGCIPTQKFVSDPTLIRDIRFALEQRHTSVLMYPEASYSFDGCATPLPRNLGHLLKTTNAPVLMVKTEGAFSFDPLYNGLQKRRVKVSADVSLLFSRQEIDALSCEELEEKLDTAFRFDGFAWQRDHKIEITEPFRADGLERILYKCPDCGAEGKTKGEGIRFVCRACGKKYIMDTFGQMRADDGNTRFPHIPDWYAWEREEVRRELEDGTYRLDTGVEIRVMVDYRALYHVGDGRLLHTTAGFVLDGCDGKLHYEQKPLFSYGLYADYFWYEIGDVICIGNQEMLYYCFPKKDGVVAKTRLAAEELYRMVYREKRGNPEKKGLDKQESL